MIRTSLVLAAALAASAALAQGTEWVEDQPVQVTGQVQSVAMEPAPGLELLAPDGALWTVELADPAQAETAGFGPDSAREGDAVAVLGHRATNEENRIRALRITVEGRPYDFAPDEIGPMGLGAE